MTRVPARFSLGFQRLPACAPKGWARSAGLAALLATLGLLLALACPAHAEDAPASSSSASGAAEPADTPDAQPADTIQMPVQTVVGEREKPRFLPDVKGVEIYEGKKTVVIDPDEPPQIVNDNYRQVLSRTPGLLVSEESTPLVSIGYRGLNPDRTQFTQVLKDGIPIAADMFGYPENYYLPPIDAIEQIDFVHGGAALLYGPQPGGALNFVTRKPDPERKFSLYSNQSFGSNDYYSTYNALSGTVDRVGYYTYYYQKQGDGFRRRNSDFALYSGSAKGTYQIDDTSSLLLNFDGYNENHSEPGGLRLTPAANAVLYGVDRNASSRYFDQFELQRYIGSAIYENELSEDTLLRIASWGGTYRRSSRRQRGGGFGTLPSGAAAQTNTLQKQIFNTAGLDARVRHSWDAFGETHTLTAGIEYFHDTSPRTEKRGLTSEANDGPIRSKNVRTTNYGSAFAENRFVWGDFALIPAIRLENYSEAVDEQINVEKTMAGVPLANESTYDFEPLFGVGAAYTLVPTVEVYANVSKAYRPQIFTEAVATSPTLSVAGDLSPGKSWQYELGFRGYPVPFAYWDTSLFWIEFDDQIGTVQLANGLSQVRNVGTSRYRGWEVAAQLGTVGLYDWWQGTRWTRTLGELSLFASSMLLDATFTAGPFEGNTPAYAPDHLVRAGVEYSWRERFRAQLFSTIVASSFGNDSNSQDFFIPSYTVWDLTLEANVYKDMVGLYFTVNNIFDQDYWARVRPDGIDPAQRRNFFGGVKVYF